MNKLHIRLHEARVTNSQLRFNLSAGKKLHILKRGWADSLRKEISATVRAYAPDTMVGISFDFTMVAYPKTSTAELSFNAYRDASLVFSTILPIHLATSFAAIDSIAVNHVDIVNALKDLQDVLDGNKKRYALVYLSFHDGGNHPLSEHCFVISPSIECLSWEDALEKTKGICSIDDAISAPKYNPKEFLIGVVPEDSKDFGYFSQDNLIRMDSSFEKGLENLKDRIESASI